MSYHTVPVTSNTSRLLRFWHTTQITLVPYRVKQSHTLPSGERVFVELLCQHPGSMYSCIEAADAERRRWLQHGEVPLPYGDGILGSIPSAFGLLDMPGIVLEPQERRT